MRLASLDLHLNGSCNIERINQFSDGNLIYIGEKGYLQVSGWNLIAGQAMSADTESYLTLIPKDNKRKPSPLELRSACLGLTWPNTTSCLLERVCGLVSARQQV